MGPASRKEGASFPIQLLVLSGADHERTGD